MLPQQVVLLSAQVTRRTHPGTPGLSLTQQTGWDALSRKSDTTIHCPYSGSLVPQFLEHLIMRDCSHFDCCCHLRVASHPRVGCYFHH